MTITQAHRQDADIIVDKWDDECLRSGNMSLEFLRQQIAQGQATAEARGATRVMKAIDHRWDDMDNFPEGQSLVEAAHTASLTET